MIRFGRHYGWWLTALAALILVGGLRATGQLQPLENAAADTRARLMMREVRSDIVIVGIDAASLAELNEWPGAAPSRQTDRSAEERRTGQRVPRHRFQLADQTPSTTHCSKARWRSRVISRDSADVLSERLRQRPSAPGQQTIAPLRAPHRTGSREWTRGSRWTHAPMAKYLDGGGHSAAQRDRSAPRVAGRARCAHRFFDFSVLVHLRVLCRCAGRPRAARGAGRQDHLRGCDGRRTGRHARSPGAPVPARYRGAGVGHRERKPGSATHAFDMDVDSAVGVLDRACVR